jgi:plasmid stabilization system protein ParE
LKVTYTEEAVADIVEAISYLNERNPTAAANLDAEITRCIDRLAGHEFDGPISHLRSGAVVRSWAVPPFRIYYQRQPGELLIVRVYYLDEALATLLGFGSIVATALGAIALIVHVVKRRLRAILVSVALLPGSVTLLLWATISVGLVGTKWPYSTVYSSKGNVHYVLCNALVPTDTAFEVPQTPSLWRPLWSRAFDSSIG